MVRFELGGRLRFVGYLIGMLVCLVLFSHIAKADPATSEAADATSETAAPDAAPDRPFPSDRPGKASGPFTVDVGHFAVEADLVNSVYDHWASSPTTPPGFFPADPVLKAGLTHDIDLELGFGGYQTYRYHDRSTGAVTHASGAGDDQVRVKFNLAGNDGSAFGIALIPYVKLPLASSSLRNAGITNNRIEGGLLVPMSYNLPDDFVLGYQAEIDANKNVDDGNFHASIVNIGSVGHPVPGIDNLSFGLEFYSAVTTSKAGDDPDIYTIDPNFAYQLTPNLQFDVETDIGLNKAAPDIQAICGIAWVF